MTELENQDLPSGDLDNLLAEFTASGVQELVADELQTSAVPGSQDDLEDILGEIQACEDAAPITGATGAGQLPPMAEKEAADTAQELESCFEEADTTSLLTARPRRGLRQILTVTAGAAVLLASNAASYFLGTRAEPEHQRRYANRTSPQAANPVAQPVRGLARYVGLPASAKVDGKTIFESDEIKSAIVQLVGGMELQSDIVTASRRYTAATPTALTGNVIQIRSCNQLDCARDSIRIDFDIKRKKTDVCVTKPFEDDRQISHAFNEIGFQEVASCEGNPFLKMPAPKSEG